MISLNKLLIKERFIKMKITKKGYLIAVDLDGTLLYGMNGKDQLAFDLLKEIAKTNYVIISTGRPLRGSINYYNELELTTPIINYNGAIVQNPKDKSFPKKMVTVNKDYIIDIFDNNRDYFENIFSEIEDDIYLYKYQTEIDAYLHMNNGTIHLGELHDTLKEDTNGAIGFLKKGTFSRIDEYVKRKYPKELLVRYWPHPTLDVIEIYSPKTSKGDALKSIIDYYHVPFEKTISIGDGHNDLDMFEVTCVNVAMGNSHEELIANSNYLTKNVDENGVYHYLINEFIDK